ELDSYAIHTTRNTWEKDHARDRALTTAGYRVVCITWRQLTREQQLLAHQLRTLLTPSAGPRPPSNSDPATPPPPPPPPPAPPPRPPSPRPARAQPRAPRPPLARLPHPRAALATAQPEQGRGAERGQRRVVQTSPHRRRGRGRGADHLRRAHDPDERRERRVA